MNQRFGNFHDAHGYRAALQGSLPNPQQLEDARRQLQQSMHRAESLVSAYPGACLAAAVVTGILVGWWIKRR